MKNFMYNLSFFSSFAIAQEQVKKESNPNAFNASIGVVDMKKFLHNLKHIKV